VRVFVVSESRLSDVLSELRLQKYRHTDRIPALTDTGVDFFVWGARTKRGYRKGFRLGCRWATDQEMRLRALRNRGVK
jgi:hypothetical protein